MMQNIKIIAAQIEVLDIFTEQEKIKNIFENDADLICFPELFCQPKPSAKNYNPKTVTTAKSLFQSLCKQHKTYAVMGSVFEKTTKGFVNRCYLINDEGEIQGYYDKINIDISDNQQLTKGQQTKVFKTKLGNIGLLICRDLLYPEASQNLAKQGAEILICPTGWCSYCPDYPDSYLKKFNEKKPPKEVDSLCAARAIENGVAFVFVNRAGQYQQSIHLGRSQLALPFYGQTELLANNQEGLLKIEVDMDLVKSAKLAYGL